MPVKVRAPLLPPLKEPVGRTVEELEEDEPLKGVDVGVVALKPVPEETVPVPDEVGESEEERAAAISNVLVWESTVLTFPTGEACR